MLKGYSFLQRNTLSLAFIILLAFATRTINIGYNAPFNDEAIYIVVGKLGIFQWDWTTFAPARWMGGIPAFYPSLAAISYTTGGIIGSRMLSVVLGVLAVEVVFLFAYNLYKGTNDSKLTAGLIAASLIAADSVSHYVSRLATYDIPCYLLLFFSLYLLTVATTKKRASSWYFGAFVSFFLSFSVKIISGWYLPLIFIFGYIVSKKASPKNHDAFKKYFVLPAIVCFGVYTVFNLQNSLSFFTSSVGREKANFLEVVVYYFQNTKFIWPFWMLGLVGFIYTKQFKTALVLFIGALWILVFHLLSLRIPSLDKHVYISIVFLSLSSGLGISYLLSLLPPKRILRSFLVGSFAGLIGVLWVLSYDNLQTYNVLWSNSHAIHTHLTEQIDRNEKVLTELGATTMLYTFDKTHPVNVTTFDWLEYQGYTGLDAYAHAVRDGYFDYLVLESQLAPKSNNNKTIHEQVITNLEGKYQQTYAENGFYIYQRNY